MVTSPAIKLAVICRAPPAVRRTSLNQRKIWQDHSSFQRIFSVGCTPNESLWTFLHCCAGPNNITFVPPFQEPTHQSSPVWQSFRNSKASSECSLGMCLTTYPSDLSHAWRPRFWEKTTGKELLKKITQSPRLQTIKADKILGNHMLSVFPFKNSGHNLHSISQVLPVPSCHPG